MPRWAGGRCVGHMLSFSVVTSDSFRVPNSVMVLLLDSCPCGKNKLVGFLSKS